jgi:cobyrinic acid a,c-diamide synthase
MTLIIAGERSGVGKTTITLSLLSFLASKNYKVQSFKVGPDYIDPMYHNAITGGFCRNLDPILTSENYVKSCFYHHTQKANYSLIEGVMGLFDGVNPTCGQDQLVISANTHFYASTAHIAKLLQLPVLLVIDCSKLSGSVAAIATGYRNLDPQVKIIGVVLNKVGSDRHLELLKQALEPLNLPILGVLKRNQNLKIPERHLGLIPSGEITNLEEIFAHLARIGETSFNWSKLLPYFAVKKQTIQANNLTKSVTCLGKKNVRIAVAWDQAFNFYYQDNLDILAHLGAELIFWSPLHDSTLPQKSQGIYFGGGFPEIFAEQLSQNKALWYSIQEAFLAGMPMYAECGGLMYLSESIEDFEGKISKMIGIIPTKIKMTEKLTLGYRQVITLQDNPFSTQNTILWGHEFHKSQMSSYPDNPVIATRNCYEPKIQSYQGWQINQVYASYIHLHFGECQPQVKRFLEKSSAWEMPN